MTTERAIELLLGNLGSLVILLGLLYAGYRGWLVPGWYARELKERNERLEARMTRLERELGINGPGESK